MTCPPVTIVSAGIRGVLVGGVPQFSAIVTAPPKEHRPYGVIKVDALPYGFRLWHVELEALGDAQAGADETLGDLDISAHASWGMEYVDVTLYRSGAKVPAAQMCVPNANVWVHLDGYLKPSSL